MTCSSCSATENLLACTWPERKFILVRADGLHVDDQIQWREQVWEVLKLNILKAPTGSTSWPTVTMTLKRANGKHTDWVWTRPDAEFPALRDSTCGALCCDLHRAERGERAVVCSSHWAAWAAVA